MSIAFAPEVIETEDGVHDPVLLDTDEDRQATPSVMKALQLLDAFRGAGPTLGVSEIARRAGVPKSTAFRLLNHLEQGGFVERSGRDYCLGRHLFELGNSVPLCRPRGLLGIAAPHLGQLFTRVQRVVHLAVLEGTEVVYLDKIHCPNTVQVDTRVGGRMPAACSSLGKVMLAYSDRPTIDRVLRAGLTRRTRYSVADPNQFVRQLSRIRAEGVAYDREEVQLGLVCVAAPVLGPDGRAVAAVSVSSQALRFDPRTVVTEVRRTAAAISLAYRA